MKGQYVLFDDTWYFIETQDDTIKCLHNSEYKDVIGYLLTNKQYEKYIGQTRREFVISPDKIQKAIEFIKNNHWRDDDIKSKLAYEARKGGYYEKVS